MPPFDRRASRSIGRLASIAQLAVLAGACTGEAADDASAEEVATRTSPPEDSFVEVNGVRLHYRGYGGTGDLLLFVPSLFMTAGVYDRVAPHFTDRYRVLAVTHRWHGTSEQTGLDFTLDTLVLDLAGFIEHFTDEPAIVFGWSQAGMLLPRLAQLRPDLVRALIFANANRERTSDPTDLRVPGRIVPDSGLSQPRGGGGPPPDHGGGHAGGNGRVPEQ